DRARTGEERLGLGLLVVGQQLLQLGAQGGVVGADFVQEGGALVGGPGLRLVEQLAQPLVPLRCHHPPPPTTGPAGRPSPVGGGLGARRRPADGPRDGPGAGRDPTARIQRTEQAGAPPFYLAWGSCGSCAATSAQSRCQSWRSAGGNLASALGSRTPARSGSC